MLLLLLLRAAAQPVLDPDCVSQDAQLIDMQVTNCYIEEGAMRTSPQLKADVQAFRYGGQISEAFAPGECLTGTGHPPCRCLLRDRGNEEECVHLTPRTSFAECGKVTIEGSPHKSGDLIEVCVPNGESRDVHVQVADFAYMFRLVSVSKRKSSGDGLVSLSADGCILHPLFSPVHHRYQCEVDCRVGGRVLLAALKPARATDDTSPVRSVSLVDAEGNVLLSELDQVITPVTVGDDGAPLRMRVVLGQALDVGSMLESNVAPVGSTVYRVTVHCLGVAPSSTSTTTTTPFPNDGIAGAPVELEFLLLAVLFSTIAAMLLLTIGKAELTKVIARIRGTGGPPMADQVL